MLPTTGILEYYFKIKFEKVGIPDFLDGIAVYKANDELCLQYKNHQCKVNS
jgi:hypothetical protein